MVQPCSKNGAHKTTKNSYAMDSESQKMPQAKKSLKEGITKAMSASNLREEHWNDQTNVEIRHRATSPYVINPIHMYIRFCNMGHLLKGSKYSICVKDETKWLAVQK